MGSMFRLHLIDQHDASQVSVNTLGVESVD